MNWRNRFAIAVVCLGLLGCGVVKRWTLNSPEAGNTQLTSIRSPNIFYDFLWTTPAVKSHLLDFSKGDRKTASFKFGGQEFTITKDAQMRLAVSNGSTKGPFVASVPSAANVYYDTTVLGTKIIPRQRLVSKTRYVTRYENVQKTRMVTQMVPVQKSRSVPTTSSTGITTYRTEYYTTNEMKNVSKNYYTMEPVRRMETYTEWETVHESFIDIPVYDVYTLQLEQGNILVYRIQKNGRTKFYLQNPQYLVASDDGGYWSENKTKILAIDSNSNGIFLEDTDRIMFNSWNPYAQNSAYQNIRGYMDNYWYTVAELKEERFISMSMSKDGSKIAIENANDPYVGNTETGHIRINNVPRRLATVTINGRKYRQKRKGYFDEKIQYGWHRLRITHKRHPDYNKDFLINQDNPSFTLDYEPKGRAGKLNLSNISFKQWKVAVIDENGKMSLYEQLSDINLSDGKYKVVISSGGLEVKKEVVISANSNVEIDVQKEIEAMFGEIPEVEGVQEALPEELEKAKENADTNTPGASTTEEAASTAPADTAATNTQNTPVSSQ